MHAELDKRVTHYILPSLFCLQWGRTRAERQRQLCWKVKQSVIKPSIFRGKQFSEKNTFKMRWDMYIFSLCAVTLHTIHFQYENQCFAVVVSVENGKCTLENYPFRKWNIEMRKILEDTINYTLSKPKYSNSTRNYVAVQKTRKLI